MSAASYCMSASKLTMTSAPMASDSVSPAEKASASPRFVTRRRTRSAPAARARSEVASVEPSSITSLSNSEKPGTRRGSAASARSIVASSLNAGI